MATCGGSCMFCVCNGGEAISMVWRSGAIVVIVVIVVIGIHFVVLCVLDDCW